MREIKLHTLRSIRLPEVLRNRLVAAAEEQQRSVSGEMRYRLEQSFKREDKLRATKEVAA